MLTLSDGSEAIRCGEQLRIDEAQWIRKGNEVTVERLLRQHVVYHDNSAQLPRSASTLSYGRAAAVT